MLHVEDHRRYWQRNQPRTPSAQPCPAFEKVGTGELWTMVMLGVVCCAGGVQTGHDHHTTSIFGILSHAPWLSLVVLGRGSTVNLQVQYLALRSLCRHRISSR